MNNYNLNMNKYNYYNDTVDADEFIGMAISGEIEDSDGFGFIIIENQINEKKPIAPSDYDTIDPDIDNILWFNY